MAKLIRVGDLRVGDNGDGKSALHCTGECDGVYSADRADYFLARADRVLKCCGEPMVRLQRRVSYREV